MNAETLAREIHAFQRAHSNLFVYALVYGVGHPQLFSELKQWFGPVSSDSRLALIFDARPEEGNAQYGPFLIRLSQAKEQPSKLLGRLAACCTDDFRSVSFLFSASTFEQLARGLRERLDVVCEDRSEWQMKFFDTRSLCVLDAVLDDAQKTAFFGIVNEWWYLDRYGEIGTIRGAASADDVYRGPLRLTEKQACAVIDAGLADSVLYSLSRTDADLLAELDSNSIYEICEQSVADASLEERESTLLLADRVRVALLGVLDKSEAGDR